jgi:plasmid replication initiation protein
MKLRFEEIKEGRKVVSIDFRFTPSTIIEQYNPVTRQIVSVTSKPKQTTVAKIRKPKKDDENTPPPVPTDQQELPNINYSETYKERTHEEIQAIINLLMKENNLTYVEAVTRAIKYKLI